MTVKEDDLEAEIKFTHTLLDTFRVPRTNSTGATFPLVGRVRHALETMGGPEALATSLGGGMPSLRTISDIVPPCRDCGAKRGEACEPDCTQASYL
jgi:hypothetical protein